MTRRRKGVLNRPYPDRENMEAEIAAKLEAAIPKLPDSRSVDEIFNSETLGKIASTIPELKTGKRAEILKVVKGAAYWHLLSRSPVAQRADILEQKKQLNAVTKAANSLHQSINDLSADAREKLIAALGEKLDLREDKNRQQDRFSYAELMAFTTLGKIGDIEHDITMLAEAASGSLNKPDNSQTPLARRRWHPEKNRKQKFVQHLAWGWFHLFGEEPHRYTDRHKTGDEISVFGKFAKAAGAPLNLKISNTDIQKAQAAIKGMTNNGTK